MPREERGDERRERGEVGGEVDVEVREDACWRRRPRVPEGVAAALRGQAAVDDAVVHFGEGLADVLGAVSARVVCDGDAPRNVERLAEIRDQGRDAVPETAFFIEDRNDDVDRELPVAAGHADHRRGRLRSRTIAPEKDEYPFRGSQVLAVST